MKIRRRFALVLVLSAMFMLTTGTAHAGWAKHYDVYYNCIISPPYWGLVGQWDVDCDGNWTGWGWMPGDNCTRTEVFFEEYCGPDVGN